MFDVTIAGDINVDLILYGLNEFIPVEREVLATDFRLTLGGSAAIFAHNLSILGSKVGFIGMTGKDEMGAVALDRLRSAGVDTSRSVQAKDGTQTGVTVLLPHGASRHILTYPGTITKLSIDDLDMDYLASSSHFHISSFFLLKRLRSELPAVCRRLKSKGLTISLDTNDDPEDRWGDDLIALLPEIDVLLPNQDEACRMSGQKNLNDAVNWLADRVRTVVVKCGAEGAVVQSAGERFAVPPVPVIPVDTVGAGDSFDAGFLSCFIAHGDLAECAALGNLAAALSTLRSGGTEAFRERELAATFLRRRT